LVYEHFDREILNLELSFLNTKILNLIQMSSQKGEKVEVPKREIGLLDLVFMNLGGQSPFLSVLIYGTAVFIIAGVFAPIAVILGTILVLFNGLVVYKLSTKFTQSGGYYTYAYYSLTKRLGFETGWTYLLYSSFYGSGYLLGAVTMLTIIFNVSTWYIALGLLVISTAFLITGKRTSFKYAMVASLLEIIIMGSLAILFLSSTHFTFYNPLNAKISLSSIASAIIFGSGIPTGYGSITPLSGEVKDPKKTVPRAIITVILLGGLLAAFDIYAITDHIIFYHIGVNSTDMLHLIENRFGLLTLAFVVFAALNDGILATLTFMFATSRTIYAMSLHGFFPPQLSKLKNKSEPINASIATAVLYWLIVLGSLYFEGGNAENAFLVVSLISLLANLYVHLATDLSLFKISLKRLRKRLYEITLAIGSAGFTLYIMLNSVPSISPVIIDIFLLWLLAGFMLAEVIDIAKQQEEEEG